MERRTFLKLAALVPGLALAGCGGSKTLLSPKDPTMLSIWHVYGEQADSPMNRLLTEFNDTVGREKGILLNVTNMTNSAAIGGQRQDAKAGKPGALDLPDLFSAHSADASALGIENLVDWNDWFTAEDMAAYVPGFVQDGIIDGQQVVFPVSKSTQLIFLNGSQYARFAADTGAQLSTLATWDGFFEMAGAYRQWSQGKPFCALDYPLRLVELNALEQGSGKLYKGSWYDLTNETFRASWMEFARALVQGDILISDLYSNTQVMTGETLAGLGSSAAILYYNDFVTYPDNTTEPTDLLLAPLPGLLPDVLSTDVKAGILSLLEISCITRMPVMQLSLLPVVCGLLSFGGICVFMQLLASGGNWMHKAEFLAMRLLAALLSAGLCKLAAPFWMRNVAVSAFAGTMRMTQSATPLLPILLVLMTFMILSQKKLDNSAKACYNKM